MEFTPEFTDFLDRYLDARAASDATLKRFQNNLPLLRYVYTAEELWRESNEYVEYVQAQKDLNNAFKKVCV